MLISNVCCIGGFVLALFAGRKAIEILEKETVIGKDVLLFLLMAIAAILLIAAGVYGLIINLME